MIGKKKMGFEVYRKICELFLKEGGDEFIFARVFLILEWNLMARSENVVHAHILHVEWSADCLVFRFVKSKGDQTGRNSDQEWHVYANPHNPEICAVLALACYLFSNPGIFSAADVEDEVVEVEGGGAGNQKKGGQLFPGGNQYDRFIECLHRIVGKYPQVFLGLGISPGDLGSHSARKGASSHACSGSTVSPPMVSICLRAMWSMGHVKERYLQYEKAGDQYLGRVVCGLDVNDVTFAVSPPFFEFDDTRQEGGDVRTSRVYSLLKDYMVQGDTVPASVHHIFYFCFASICFHFDFLKQVLHEKNKLRASHFFTHIPVEVKAAATVRYPWDRTEMTPTLTGIPPHITILANFRTLMVEMESTKDAIISGLIAELDRRRIGSQSHFDKEEILTSMTTMHNDLLKKMDLCMRNSQKEIQVVPLFDSPADYVNEIFVNAEEESKGMKPVTIVPASSEKKFHFFYSKGELRRLPPNFVFPHMGLCLLIVNWFCGNPSKKIMPLKLIVPRDLHSPSMKGEHRKMRSLISAVISKAKEKGEWDAGNGAWDVGRAVQLYNSVKNFFEYPSLTSAHRDDQISWRTVYNLYIKSLPNERGQGRGRRRRRRRDLNEGGTEIGDEERWADAIEG
jgi:hypothetical protein